jgi:hypothetical protein
MLSRGFYISMQHRYRSLSIQYGYINNDDEHSEDNEGAAELISTKNYISIFGKFYSKMQMSVNFNLINLDPLNQDDKLLFQKRKNSPLVSIEDGDSDAPVRVYETFRCDKDIK